MRIWDIDPGYLDRQRLLGEHRELHGLFNILTQGKRGYSKHPETLRWVGCVPALAFRHELLAEEMALRGYNHQSPLSPSGDMFSAYGVFNWPGPFIDPPADQFALLRQKFGSGPQGRVALPGNPHELWAQHKYSIMARDPALYRKLGPEVAARSLPFARLAGLLVDALRRPPAPGRLANALMHMWGYVNRAPGPDAGLNPAETGPAALLARIRENARRLESNYLEQSTALGELGAWARFVH